MSMADAPPSEHRRDWSGRARTTASEALRYTKFVTVMKRALTLGAAAIIGAVLVFFFIQRQPRQVSMSYEKLGHVEDDLAMVKPRLTGTDDKGNPFVITADAAIQDAKNPKRARLNRIEADIALDKDTWLNARARQGVIDMAAGRMSVTGGIDIFTDSGYELHTESARMDLKQNVVQGDRPVTGQGPLGTLRADTFRADQGSRQLLLSGHVHMTFDGSRK